MPVFNVGDEFPLADLRQSSQTSLPHSHAHSHNQAPPIHGRRSRMRVRWETRSKQQCLHSYPARVSGQEPLLDLTAN